MQIGSSPSHPFSTPTESKRPSESNAPQKPDTKPRHKRSVDLSRANAVSDSPDANKAIEHVRKAPAPVELGSNPTIDSVIAEIASAFKTATQDASIFLKEKFAEMAKKATTPVDKEKWAIDPDNTYLVTFDYNTTGERPYPAKIIQHLSLTQALITNAQDTPKGEGFPVSFYKGGPEVIIKPCINTYSPGIFDFASRFNPYREKANNTHTYQGIYEEFPEADAAVQVYNGTFQSPITPEEFKRLAWASDYQKPYKKFLDEFWSSHQENYPTMAKASLVKSAIAQHQEGSLTLEGRKLVMRAAGLSDHQASWPDIELKDLRKNPRNDPTLEIGLLTLGNFKSTDLVYITDTQVKFDADGIKIPPLTLLYITGNSSPIHSFSSLVEMKAWLAKQMVDPIKSDALASHCALRDKPNGLAYAGIDETLAGLAAWPEKRETPGGLFSYDHRAFSGFWDPQKLITTHPEKLPFAEIAKRQKCRSYADADVSITSDRDVTKKHILSGLEKAAKAAMFLSPLALVIPEVGLALDAFFLANAATTTGIGIDDKVHGKPKATEHIVFGVLNAALVTVPRILSVVKSEEGVVNEVESSALTTGGKSDKVTLKTPYKVSLNKTAAKSISHKQLKKNWVSLHKAPGNQGLNCYEASIRVGQAEKTLSPDVFDAVISATNRQGGTNYSEAYLALMGINPNSLKKVFNTADIPESGFLNFKHAHEGGEFAHTVYIQKADNNELYLYNTNSPDLDLAMIRNGHPLEVNAGMTVYHLGKGKEKGLQDFLDGLDGKSGWQFAYTPASTLNAHVKNLKH